MKKVRMLLFSVLFFVFLIPLQVSAAEEADVWDGSIKEPEKQVTIEDVTYYEISTAEELAYISQTGGDWLSYNYILTNNIVLNDIELTYDEDVELTVNTEDLQQWLPIGSYENPFSGIFNGGGYSISGAYINCNSLYVGLFSSCDGSILNLSVTNSYVRGNGYTGGICGYYTGEEMTSCSFDGAVVHKGFTLMGHTGGIVGYAESTLISDCVNYGDVWSYENQVGGIAGWGTDTRFDNCTNFGKIHGGYYVGGITAGGYYFNNCKNEGNAEGYEDVGGICGLGSSGDLMNCINKGNIIGNDYVGGIYGKNIENTNIHYAYNTGTVTGKNYIGGILGCSKYNDISDCYNIGNITGENYVGGISGHTNYTDVTNSYNVGNITGTSNVGAFIGYSNAIWGRGEVSKCYYFKDDTVNVNISGFGIGPDYEGVVRSKKMGYFPILLDDNADPSYEYLGYKNGESDDSIEAGTSQIQPPTAETVWDGTILKPTVLEWVDGICYYKIYTGKELAYIAQTGGEWLTYNYILANDIVLNDVELTYDENGNITVGVDELNQWTPIGSYKNSYEGMFDGGEYSISGVYVNSSNDYTGFFSCCNGNISNLTITNSYIKAKECVGGICGLYNGQEMSYCYYDGAIVQSESLLMSEVGGLVGKTDYTCFSYCGNYADVWSTSNLSGGVVGSSNSSSFNNCFNKGNITGNDNIGGIAGNGYEFNECSNEGIITGNNYVGGITGEGKTFKNCNNKGKITGNEYVGGISGNVFSGYTIKCVNDGKISGNNYVGGIFGCYDGYISYTYNRVNVVGKNYVGGIAGYTNYTDASYSYNVGNITGTSNVGAVIGYSNSVLGKGVVYYCYYFKDDSVNTNILGFGNASDVEEIVEPKEIDFFCINSFFNFNADGHTYDNENLCSKKCIYCDLIVEKHKFEWIVDTVSTCNNEGKKHEECTACHTSRNFNTIIPATGGHKYDNDLDSDCNACGDIRDITYTGWHQDSNNWFYYKNGTKITGWEYINENWYYFNSNGVMNTGWLQLGNTKYYLSSSGEMLTGWQYIGSTWYYFYSGGNMATGWLQLGSTKYYLKNSGVMATGWQYIGSSWYYFQSGGNMVKGWLQLGNSKYYFNNSGVMTTGWQRIGSSWYYFQSGGNMTTGWLQLGKTKYYFNNSGVMATGWKQINSTWYYFHSEGNMITGWSKLGNTWYYFDNTGAMQTGWEYIGSTWYYFQSEGNMRTGWLKLGSTWYYFNNSGAMVTGWQTINGTKYYFNSSGAWAS